MKIINHKVAGGFQILLSSILVFGNISTLYDYRVNPYVLRLFWIPEWVLVVQAMIGFIGIFCGILVLKKRIRIMTGYLIFGVTWLLGFVTEIIVLN